MTTLINGQAKATININDRGLQYGDGLFETIAIIDGEPPLWDRHMQRLQQGCAALKIPLIDTKLLYSEAQQLWQAHISCVVKITITRGQFNKRGYRVVNRNINPSDATRIISCYPWPNHAEENFSQGVAVYLCETRLGYNPRLAGYKHLNRLEQVLAANEWEDPDLAEGLMMDQQDNIISGTMTNIFLVKDKHLYTPDLSQCGVVGVMRGLILEIAESLGLMIHVTKVSLATLMQADEVFLSNSIIGIWPVRKLQDHRFQVGPITRKLNQLISKPPFHLPGTRLKKGEESPPLQKGVAHSGGGFK